MGLPMSWRGRGKALSGSAPRCQPEHPPHQHTGWAPHEIPCVTDTDRGTEAHSQGFRVERAPHSQGISSPLHVSEEFCKVREPHLHRFE